jgi:hypothetical protein
MDIKKQIDRHRQSKITYRYENWTNFKYLDRPYTQYSTLKVATGMMPQSKNNTWHNDTRHSETRHSNTLHNDTWNRDTRYKTLGMGTLGIITLGITTQ